MRPEQTYLTKFRDLAGQRQAVRATIDKLRGVCDSLKDWEQTAADLASRGSRPEWNDANLAAIAELRTMLCDYHLKAMVLRTQWDALSADEQLGLAHPDSVKELR